MSDSSEPIDNLKSRAASSDVSSSVKSDNLNEINHNANDITDPIIFEGYLLKESQHLKTTRKRWIVLTKNYLYAYKKKQKYTNPTEIFDLSIYDTVFVSRGLTNMSSNSLKKLSIRVDSQPHFSIRSTKIKQQRLFTAPSNDERMEWIKQIKKQQIKHALQISHSNIITDQHSHDIDSTDSASIQIDDEKKRDIPITPNIIHLVSTSSSISSPIQQGDDDDIKISSNDDFTKYFTKCDSPDPFDGHKSLQNKMMTLFNQQSLQTLQLQNEIRSKIQYERESEKKNKSNIYILNKKLSNITSKYKKQSKHVGKLTDELKEKNDMILDLENELKKKNELNIGLNKQIVLLKDNNSVLNQENDTLNGEIKKKNDLISNLENELKKKNELNVGLNKQIVLLVDNNNILNGENGKLKKEILVLNESYSALEENNNILSEENVKLKEEILVLNGEIKDKNKNINLVKEEKDVILLINVELNNEISTLTDNNKLLKKELNQCNEKLNDEQELKKEQNVKIIELENELSLIIKSDNDKKKEISILNEELNECKEKINEFEKIINNDEILKKEQNLKINELENELKSVITSENEQKKTILILKQELNECKEKLNIQQKRINDDEKRINNELKLQKLQNLKIIELENKCKTISILSKGNKLLKQELNDFKNKLNLQQEIINKYELENKCKNLKIIELENELLSIIKSESKQKETICHLKKELKCVNKKFCTNISCSIKRTVFGYIRLTALTNGILEVPENVPCTVLLYYHEKIDRFDSNLCGITGSIFNNNKIIQNQYNEWCTYYGTQCIPSINNNYKYKWKLKINGGETIYIGLDGQINGNKLFIENINQPFYGYYGYLDGKIDYLNGSKYGLPTFGYGDIVIMKLKFTKNSGILSFIINDGIEFIATSDVRVGDDIKYRLAISMHYDFEYVELLDQSISIYCCDDNCCDDESNSIDDCCNDNSNKSYGKIGSWW